MDVLDRFLNRVAYKFDKGYPDVNNPKDMEMLMEMVNNILSEVTDAEEGIEILKREFDFKDEDFKKVSGTRYKVLVPRAERFDYAQKMDALDDFQFDPNAKNVVFIGQNKNYATRAIKDVKDVGYDVAGGKKADVVLIGDKDYPISIKKDNAGFWESSDTRYKDVVNKLSEKIKNGDFAPELTFRPFKDRLGNVKEGINIMYNEKTDRKVTGVIVTDLPSKDEQSIIFGSDTAVVVYRTYTPRDFTEEGDTIKIEVSKIIEDIDDVEEFNLEPVLNIRHDSTRKATGGLRATVQPENLLYKNGSLTGDKIELSYNEIMK